ncbi:hypothetical protein Ahy_A09g042890 [Arachis hypogaea]|uniref:Uncharacterized protein n=1 Tax=Arachis hypogaea TaxID=3818 RepID=A0A445BH77_ARAHY|nr:hypothetical protein Ahy_A09g042890 [Arachis hypogaea]
MMSSNKFSADRGSPPQPLSREKIYCTQEFLSLVTFYYAILISDWINTIANYSCYCKFHEDMVDILHVSLLNPKWSFSCSFLGKPLSNTQVVLSIINGAITALYFVLREKGLRSCGPVRAILSEYSGAILGYYLHCYTGGEAICEKR